MIWRGRRESSNVEDDRAASGGRSSGVAGLLMIIFRVFGVKGVLIALVAGGVLWKTGLVDPGKLFSDRPAAGGASLQDVSAQEQERFHFVKVVLADTEDVWTAEFARQGRKYEVPILTIYRGSITTDCGQGSAQAVPFYCPQDQKVYIDLSFYDELAQTFKSPGELKVCASSS